ncbi:glycosyltransferase family 2 protein [Adlercreutzia faecimuris]|uniref:Glycosyltransferase n=1 Tax=Adlercreutzia faecimuris TaxID=2897341 RepID=A0ABS9WG44_9ACTN|nr:glycosyltransferase [Adlercreutzia sp. JBNU-10]
MGVVQSDDRSSPRVSLLVPVYNVERYLRECLESARTQTLEEIEIICVNDGSTDGSRAILEEFAAADSRFRVIDKENSGYGASMNRGLEVARGEFVGILESDDFLDPDALEMLYRSARDTDAEVAKADFYLHWSQPEPRDERFGWVGPEMAGMVDPRDCLEVFFLKPSIWSALYRRSFLEQNGIRFLETPGASYQDSAFNFKVWACARQAVLVDRAFLHYRQDNESSSVNAPGKVFCVCDEYEEMLRYVEEREFDAGFFLPVLAKMRYDSYLWNFDRLTPALREEFAQRMAEDFRREDEAGVVDFSLFEPWKIPERQAVIDDPSAFCRRRASGGRDSKLTILARCWRAGGPSLVAHVLKSRLSRR